MSDKVEIKIVGKNETSAAFQGVARDAQKMGDTIDQSSQKSARSLKEVEDKAKAVGAGIGTLVGVAALSGRAFQNQEQQIRSLNRAYGESSDEIQKFSKELQDNTVYSDDAARNAAQVASTLTRSYGLTADQIQTLISRTADLATVNVTSTGAQFDLADAVSRTAGAIRGEGEAAEALGLTLSDSAVAAAAAARGLTGWNTTMSEAEKAQFRFTLLLEQSTYAQGAAAEAAETNAGKARQFINTLQDQTQAFGGALGPMGEYLSVLGDMALVAPLVGAAIGKIGTALAALGGGPVVAGAAVLAGTGLLSYNAVTNPYGTGSDIFAQFGAGGAGLANSLLPGNPFSGIQDQFTGILQGNDLVDAVGKLFYQQPGTMSNVDPGTWAIGRLKAAGILPADFSGTIDEAAKYIESSSNATGMSKSQYVERKLSTSTTYTYDPISGQYVYNDTLTGLSQERRLAALPSVGANPGYGSMYQIAQGQASLNSGRSFTPTGNYDPAIYASIHRDQSMASMGAASVYEAPANAFARETGDSTQTSMAAMQAGSVNQANQLTAALKEQLGGWYDIRDGITSAADAQTAWQMINETVITQQQVYSGQISEYSQQQGALTDAYDILLKRQQEGIALSEEEQALLDNYPGLYERVTGGVEDATVANGLLAAQYIENMKQGDALNESMKGQTDAVGGLTRIIEEMILAMEGVPTEVKTAILLENADESISDLIRYQTWLNSIPGYVQTVVDTVFVESGDGSGGRVRGVRLGGVVGYANGGVTVELAEAGPELLHFRNGGSAWAMDRGVYNVPKGTYVDTAPVSKMKAGGGGGVNNFYGPVTVVANNPQQFMDAMRESNIGGSRQ